MTVSGHVGSSGLQPIVYSKSSINSNIVPLFIMKRAGDFFGDLTGVVARADRRRSAKGQLSGDI